MIDENWVKGALLTIVSLRAAVAQIVSESEVAVKTRNKVTLARLTELHETARREMAILDKHIREAAGSSDEQAGSAITINIERATVHVGK